ncbi:13380_t:CDS:1, partial [Racocetra fulgida]
ISSNSNNNIATTSIAEANAELTVQSTVEAKLDDKIKHYIDTCYVSASETFCRIMHYKMHNE